MSSAEQPNIVTRAGTLAQLSVVPGAGPALRSPHDSADSWPRTDGDSAGTLPAPGQPGHGLTARLRRQPLRHVDAFEVICPDCGDNPDLDYSEVSPWLQCLRGPRTIQEGLAVYIEHTGGWASA